MQISLSPWNIGTILVFGRDILVRHGKLAVRGVNLTHFETFATGRSKLLSQNGTPREGLLHEVGHTGPVHGNPLGTAQGSRQPTKRLLTRLQSSYSHKRTASALCMADGYDMDEVVHCLRAAGYRLDPFHTGLTSHVVHFQYLSSPTMHSSQMDVFVMSTGSVVVWGQVGGDQVNRIVATILTTAAKGAHSGHIEVEDLEFYEDSNHEHSQIIGDTIMLGTGSSNADFSLAKTQFDAGQPNEKTNDLSKGRHDRLTKVTLTKIAFSFGLARSVKVAILESQLEEYFASTGDIPKVFMTKTKLPYTRQFVLRKTGQLLSMRSKLNLSSELTDALPEVFWDSRHELGLENCFIQVSRALDVGVRIKALNEKISYAQEIALVLQDRLSERHGHLLEWLIIALISVEISFEIVRLVREQYGTDDSDRVRDLLNRHLESIGKGHKKQDTD